MAELVFTTYSHFSPVIIEKKEEGLGDFPLLMR
jgi:hypothetical protein